MPKKLKDKVFSFSVYASLGILASFSLFLVFYWSLRLNASIDNLVRNYYDIPLYFWPYVILTIGTLILFGLNVPLLVFRWRKYGFPKVNRGAGTGLGATIGILASACPVCGSTLLSAIGIAGGLTAFPFAGLELKAASFALMALPLFLTGRELKRFETGVEACPIPKNPSFKIKKHKPLLAILVGLILFLILIGWSMLASDPIFFQIQKRVGIVNPTDNQLYDANQVQETNNPIYDEVVAKVLPEEGFQSKIVLGDSVIKLVQNGVIDKQKFEDIYKQSLQSQGLYKERASLPTELTNVLMKPSFEPILLTRQNANYYVNLLWPLGLSNYMSTNKKSPVNGKSLFNFASTGGWNLGKAKNGGSYFNKFSVVPLTPNQEALVTQIAEATYRPCCNNSTFFQDCNHGSALLGLLQLGASQGLTEDELYREALAFNSFWFPQNYIQTALYFKVVKNIDWEKVNPKEVMGYDYSAVGSWSKNVQTEIAKIPNLIPQTQGGAGCGV